MDKEKKNLQVFGCGLALILSFVFVKLWRTDGPNVFHIFLAAAVVALLALAILNYRALLPLYGRWMKVAHIIGGVVTVVILSVFFYFIFGLIGIMLWLFKKDFLEQRLDPAANSYWIKKEARAFNKNNYTRQF